MAPFISESFNLTAAPKGFMVSVPIIARALMRFPLAVLSQYIGRKNAAMVEMGMIIIALLYGYLFVGKYNEVLAMGVLLGIAGGSFDVALSLGSLVPAKIQGPGDGHCRCRQLGHRVGRVVRAATGNEVRLDHGQPPRRRHHNLKSSLSLSSSPSLNERRQNNKERKKELLKFIIL